MKGIGNRLNKYYKKVKSTFFRLVNDIRNIKGIGIYSLLKRNKVSISILISCIIVLGVALVENNLSKEEFLNKFENSIINNDVLQLSKLVKVNDEKVPKKELQPLIDEYINDTNRVHEIVYEINRNGKSGNFEIVEVNSLFHKKYYIDIKEITVNFITDIKNIEVEFGNKRFNIIDEAAFDVIPGSYTLKYNYKSDYGDITENKEISLIESTTIDLEIEGKYITIYSNFDDSKVFINNKYTGLLAKDIKNYGPFPNDSDIKIYLEREFPWGVIKSEEVNVDNDQYIKLDINMVNDKLNSIINETINNFYNSSFEALNNDDKSNILNASDEVKELIYNYINEKVFLLSNNYEIKDLSIEIEKSDFKYEDNKYKASVLSKISYNVYKRLLPFIKHFNENYFILNLEYKDGIFFINGIQRVDI